MGILKSMLSGIVSKHMKRKLTSMTIREEDVEEVLRQIRVALLDADVNLKVAKDLIKSVRDQVVGYTMEKGEEPDKVLLKVLKTELVKILGENQAPLIMEHNPTKIMLVGLNGAGKTTSVAKVANWLKIKHGKKPMVVALDVYRPAAIDQLEALSNKIEVPCYIERDNKDVVQIADNGLLKAKQDGNDIVIFDTAGRLQTNQELMDELINIKNSVNPHEIILVVDAMAGQDIINVAEEFDRTLNLTGLIITKLDSEARAGAVLSITKLLNIPVKFTGTGEQVGSLDIFYPDRMADQILGLGDIMTLAEKAADKIDEEDAKHSFARMLSGKFDLEDLLKQMGQISKLGSLGSIMKMMPGNLQGQISEDQVAEAEAKIAIAKVLMSSMTKKERRNPALFKKEPNRKIRVVKGSGRKPDELNKLLKQWEQAKIKMEEMGKRLRAGKGFGNLFGGGGMQ